MKKSVVICVAFICLCSQSFAASLHSLNKNQVMKLFEDKTITPSMLITINKQLVPTTFTSYLKKNGVLMGKFSEKPEGQPQVDQGIWTVKANGELCFTWQHWTENKPECMNVYDMHNSIVLINSTNGTLKSVILDHDLETGNQLRIEK